MAGTIFSGTYPTGIYLNNTSTEIPATVAPSGYVTSSNGNAVGAQAGIAWTLTNYGTITAPASVTSTGSIVGANAINLLAGTVQNGSSGSTSANITGYHIGVFIGSGGPGTVTNFGTIASTQTSSAYFTGVGVVLQDGGSVNNSGLIESPESDISAFETSLSLTNSGIIRSTGTSGSDAIAAGAGSITNTGTISAASGGGIFFESGGGQVTNEIGGLIAAAGNGIYADPGTSLSLTNSGTIKSMGTSGSDAIAAGAGSITNTGTISAASGEGIFLPGGGNVVNGSIGVPSASIIAATTGVSVHAPSTITNYGTIKSTTTGTSGEAIYLEGGGAITNYGLITGVHAPTPGSYGGVIVTHNLYAVIRNIGTISSTNTGNGINLDHGGTIVNGSTDSREALITGSEDGIYGGGHNAAAYGADAAAHITNYGTIQSTGTSSGIKLVSGGTITNEAAATISSQNRTAISLENLAGAVTNFGTILSTAPLSGTTGAGIYLQHGGVITNEASGLLAAYRTAITLGGTVATNAAALVTNFGQVIGNVGVGVKGVGDTGANTIVNYGTITGTSGIAVKLGAGAETLVIEPGSVLSGAVGNFQPGDTIDLPGFAFASGGSAVLASGNLLEITEGGQTDDVQLDPNQLFINPVFPLAPDASSGTLIGLSESFTSGQNVTVPATEYTAGLGVPNGSEEIVESGGSAIATTVSGTLDVQGGGVASAAVIDSGGSADNFGTVSNTVVNSGGGETVESGGIDDATTVSGGGVEIVSAGGTASGTLLLGSDGQGLASGAAFAAASDIIGNTVIIPIAAEQLVYGTAIGTVIDGGTLVLEAGGSLGGAVTFAGSGGTLQILGSAVPANRISGFAPGDAIDLPDIAYDSSGSLTLQAGNTLVLSAGGAASDLDFDPEQAFVGEQFGFALDSGGGTEIGLTGEGIGAGQVDSITSGQHGFDINVLSGGIAVVYGVVSGGTIASTGQEYAQPGGSTQNVVILSGGDEFVEIGGSAGGTVADGGSQVVYGGANGTVIDSGSYLYLESGSAADTVVSSGVAVIYGAESGTTDYGGGYDFVFAGGGATGTTLSGGEEYVETGAGATGTIVEDGGAQVLYGTAVSTTLDSGTSAYLEPGSIASGVAVDGALAVIYGAVRGATVAGGGYDYVEPGGTIFGTVLNGGDEYVESGAAANGTIIDSGNQVIYGTTTGTVIDGGSYEYVYPGGTASGTIVNSGVESIFTLAIGTVVHSGGYDYINDGSASGTIIEGGDEQVEFATSAVGTLVSGASGAQSVYGTASDTTLVSGGEEVVEVGGVASATTVDSGGFEYVASGGAAAGATISGGALELTSGAIAAATIVFATSAGGQLRLDDSQAFSGTVAGFGLPDQIDLADIAFGASTASAFQEAPGNANGTLTVGDGTHTASIVLLGQYVAGQFNLASDGNGGTLVTDPPPVLATAEPPALTANHHA